MGGFFERRFFWPFFFFLILIVGAVALFSYRSLTDRHCDESPSVSMNGRTWSVTVARTAEERQLGLSGTPKLEPDHGMLFVFPEAQIQEFWMKNMNYPIDIVWINGHHQVVGVAEHASPDSYPNTFISPTAVPYVLELNAGMVRSLDIASGTVVMIDGCL